MKTRCFVLLILFFVFFLSKAQELDNVKSQKFVNTFFGGYWDIEFNEKGNDGYNEVLKNHQNNQSSNNKRSQVYYQSGGIMVDNDPPAWTKSRSNIKNKQEVIRNRQIRNAQINNYNQKIREHNRIINEQRRLNEERREAERREKERREYQKKYNAEFNRVMDQTLDRFNRQVDFALQQKENMRILKGKDITTLPPIYSGYVPSNGQTVKPSRSRTSYGEIVTRGGKPAGKNLDSHMVPTTLIKNIDKYQEIEFASRKHDKRKEGDPLGNALYYAKKGVNASTIGDKMTYQRKSAWAMSEEITGNGGSLNINLDLKKKIERAVLKQGKTTVPNKSRPMYFGQENTYSSSPNLQDKNTKSQKSSNNTNTQSRQGSKPLPPKNTSNNNSKTKRNNVVPNSIDDIEYRRLLEIRKTKLAELESWRAKRNNLQH